MQYKLFALRLCKNSKNQEVAKLIKVGISPKSNAKQGKLDFRKSRGLGKEIWANTNIENYIAKERSEWS